MFKRNCLESNPFINVEHSTFLNDKKILELIRNNINNELLNINLTNIKYILEVGPSNDTNKMFKSIQNLDGKIYHTLDIINNKCTFVADITNDLTSICNIKYDLILLCEVIEHTTNPFKVLYNLKKILNDNGIILITFPFNFRLHGPLPDCWRISEFGMKNIIQENNMKIHKLEALILEERPYFPIHYVCICSK